MMLLSCSDAIGERSNLIDGDTLVGEKPTLSFDFNSHDGEYIKNAADGKNYHIENLFNKENKVILSTADTPEGAKMAIAEYYPSKGPLTKLMQTGSVLSAEKERKGPAEEALQAYTAHMKKILKKENLLK